ISTFIALIEHQKAHPSTPKSPPLNTKKHTTQHQKAHHSTPKSTPLNTKKHTTQHQKNKNHFTLVLISNRVYL
ncbi:hypothetical protein, partial [Companilactobacillus bobalius]|uniref:hypothetical protein n=1 Tax=Companilactobacillus bobalius TaxID=2801451 RepID=UPI001F42EAD1